MHAGRFETRHAAPKNVVAKSNKRGLERQTVLHSPVQNAVLCLARRGPSGPDDARLSGGARAMPTHPDELVARLLGTKRNDYHGGESEGFDNLIAWRTLPTR